jgi:rod shape-determining protein MreD
VKAWKIVVAVGAAAGIETLLSLLAPELASRVDVFLVVIGAVARTGSRPGSILCGAAAGGIEDALSGDLFGLNGFAKTVIGYALSSLSGRFLVDHPLTIVAAMSASVAANVAITSALRFLLAQSGSGPDLEVLLSRAALTAVAGLVAAAVARYPWRERWRVMRMRRLRSGAR